MTTQAEQILENILVDQLKQLGYQKVIIRDETDLLNNLKSQAIDTLRSIYGLSVGSYGRVGEKHVP